MTVALRRLIDHAGRTSNGGLREALSRPLGAVRISIKRLDFSVMTHNMGLLVAPAPYLGTDRSGTIAEIIERILSYRPDVVGLCEVFDDDERKDIRTALADIYPYWRDGPDEDDFESDGGLLVLSRHPLLATSDTIFRDADGWDQLANKGIIHIRIQPDSFHVPIDLFYSHTQDIETDEGPDTLYSQLSAMNNFVNAQAGRSDPRIIFGDLNIPAEQPKHYGQLIARLDNPRDCWTLAGNPVASGFTFVVDNDFYEDPDDRATADQRLDYILLRADPSAIPILAGIDVLNIKRNGRNISDHFGLRASFDHLAMVSG
jgi:endonuclease/exonuclease/phosphatase family metal-dependent hydrolase